MIDRDYYLKCFNCGIELEINRDFNDNSYRENGCCPECATCLYSVSMPLEAFNEALDSFGSEEDYRMTLVKAFISIESCVNNFLRNRKMENGISSTKLDKFNRGGNISYKLNLELPLFIPNSSSDIQELINRVERLRKIRNKVVHKNHEVSREDAKLALETSEKILHLLESHQPNIDQKDH